MSPLFAALPPGDLPSHAYVPPTGVHGTAPLLTAPSEGTHTVASGETVYGIAAEYGVSPDAIVRANALPDGGRWIMPGTALVIPGEGGVVAAPAPASSGGTTATAGGTGGTITVRAGDTLSQLAIRHQVSVKSLVSANSIVNSRLIYPGQVLVLPGSPAATKTGASPAPRGGTSVSATGTITVRGGDTLYGLAARHGVTVSALASANDIGDVRLIYPGQTLRLPGAAATGTAPASSGASSDASAPAPASTSSSTSSSSIPATLGQPYTQHTVGDLMVGEPVPNTFLHYTYSDGVARAAAANRAYLATAPVPSRAEIQELIVATSERHGVDPDLMLALSYQESGWNQRAVSPANAIGAMQVIPTSGEWASSLIGRELNLLDAQDNVTAGVVIMRTLLRSADSADDAIGGYYQGLGSVREHGLFPDTQQYVRNIKHYMKTL